jgi:EKC/KEOPS complex subunit CGI121/TPRKB
MSLLETVQLEHLPPGYSISLALFQHVKNSAFLHEQLLAGNTEFEYALIDASVVRLPSPIFLVPLFSHCLFPLPRDGMTLSWKILETVIVLFLKRSLTLICQLVSRVHALAAVYRAVSDLLGGRLRSRNVHSEIVFSLSPNNNVSAFVLLEIVSTSRTHVAGYLAA